MKTRLLLAIVLFCAIGGSLRAQAQFNGLAPQQTASSPLQIRVSDGDNSSLMGTWRFLAENVTLTASATNYVYFNLASTPPVLTVNTTGFPTSTYYPIATVTTNGSQITAMTDSRPGFNTSLSSGSGGGSQDIATFQSGVGSNGQIIAFVALNRQTTFPASAPNSHAGALTAATGSTTFTLYQCTAASNYATCTSFATVVFSASGKVGAWTQAAGVTFAAGDALEVAGPGTADATLANVSITLAGCKGTATSCS
jgi:hypothetical protein